MKRMTCTKCQKAYKVPDEWVGKRLKCKACGAALRDPDLPELVKDEADPGSSDSGHRTLVGKQGEISSSTGPDWDLIVKSSKGAGKPGSGAAVADVGEERPLLITPMEVEAAGPRAAPSVVPIAYHQPLRQYRNNDRPEMFVGDVVDFWLPVVLMAMGYGTILWGLVRLLMIAPDPTRILLMFTGAAAVFMVVIVPITSCGVRLTATLMRFELPDGIMFRLYAILAAPMALAVVLFGVVSPGPAIVLFLALVWPLMFLLMQLLYHLRFVETIVASIFSTMLYVASILLVVGVMLVIGLVKTTWSHIQSDGASAGQGAVAAEVDFPATKSISGVQLPRLPAGRELESNVLFHEVRYRSSPLKAERKLWVYRPANPGPRGSRPCVLIAAAGGTGMTGMRLSEGDRPEHLPYVRQGMVVVAYEVDGEAPGDQLNDAWFAAAQAYRAAGGGLSNGREALEFALARIPEVDSRRCYAVGHSSAGSQALLLAAAEERLAGCVAYAPVADWEARRSDLLTLSMESRLPGERQFLREASPLNHVQSIRCPVLLFHTKDDGGVPITESQKLFAALQGVGARVQLVDSGSGGHHQAMIQYGIEAGIRWIGSPGSLPARSAEAAVAQEPRTPAAQAQDSVTTMLAGLSNPDAGIRRSAAATLATWLTEDSAEAEKIVTALRARVDDPDEGVQISALQALSRWRKDEAGPVLVAKLEPPTTRVAQEAASLLGRIKAAEGLEPLVRLLAEPKSRHWASEALGAYGQAAEKVLQKTVESPDAEVRAAGAELLARAATKESLAIVRQLARDENQRVAEAGRRAWMRLAPEEMTPTTVAMLDLSGSDYFAKKRALRTLADEKPAQPDPAVARAIEAMVIKESHFLDDAVGPALANWADAQTASNLAAALKQSTSSQTRRNIMAVLGYVEGPEVADALAEVLGGSGNDRYEARLAGDALVRMGAKGEPAVIKLLRHSDAQVVRDACEVLGRIGGAKSVNALIATVRQYGTSPVGRAARQAIEKIRFRAQTEKPAAGEKAAEP